MYVRMYMYIYTHVYLFSYFAAQNLGPNENVPTHASNTTEYLRYFHHRPIDYIEMTGNLAVNVNEKFSRHLLSA